MQTQLQESFPEPLSTRWLSFRASKGQILEQNRYAFWVLAALHFEDHHLSPLLVPVPAQLVVERPLSREAVFSKYTKDREETWETWEKWACGSPELCFPWLITMQELSFQPFEALQLAEYFWEWKVIQYQEQPGSGRTSGLGIRNLGSVSSPYCVRWGSWIRFQGPLLLLFSR